MQTSQNNPVQGPFPSGTAAQAAQIIAANIANVDAGVYGGVGHQQETTGMLGYASFVNFSGQKQEFLYNFGQVPVGLLVGEIKDDHFFVDLIVASPMTRGCGTALLETAANHSLNNGKLGILKLMAGSAAACAAYQALGFVRDNGGAGAAAGPMTLNPGLSDRWHCEGGVFSVTAMLGQSYAIGF